MPYWRLSGFYLFYFASLGVLVPYWSLYLKSLGYSAVQIGELLAIIMATKIVSPNIWGWIADHTGKRMAIVRSGSLLAALAFLGVFLGSGYWWLMGVMLLFSFFWNAALPQFEATTMTHLGDEPHRYSTIRLWGSIGFILAVAALGPVLEQHGATLVPAVLLILIMAIWLMSLLVPERAAGYLPLNHERLANVLRRPQVLALLLVCLLMQASHGPYYTFYTIYLEAHGYSRGLIGQLWALGVIAEVILFLALHRLVPRFGLRRLLLSALLLAALRWVMIGWFVDNLPLLIVAQLLHAASFGVYHGVAIQLIHRYFTGRHQGRGQALYSSMSFGLGGALGALYSGYAWDSLSPQTTFMLAALISLVSFVVAWRSVYPDTTVRHSH
ncbi:MAG: MFS transporter [Gammaproteobacteria bacterium RBG_16_57_12]|nr:MAG: MFS transporter [Gammaproteobacteria bacterium RBG_16_57_12]